MAQLAIMALFVLIEPIDFIIDDVSRAATARASRPLSRR